MNDKRTSQVIFVLSMAIIVTAVSTSTALAQSSASYRLEESVFNAGGHPSQGVVMSSASYRIKLDSIGEPVVAVDLSSASYFVDSGFGTAYRPPGIVDGLVFVSDDTLEWTADIAADSYNLYRSKLIYLDNYGDCYQPGLTAPTATDGEIPSTGVGYFYLVTAVNRIDEEGGKGFDSDGATREGNWCP